MAQEYLLDRQEFLQWLLDLLEKSKTSDDVLLKFLVPLISRVSGVSLSSKSPIAISILSVQS